MAVQVDPLSNPQNPRQISFNDVQEAAELLDLLKPFVQRTICVDSHCEKQFNMSLYYKMENLQRSGSFKSRGILCALLRLPEKKRKNGVVIASLGNAALGLCYFTHEENIPVTVVMPINVSISLKEKITKLGAKIILHGRTVNDINMHARSVAHKNGLTYINSRDYVDILAGYGTIALEILQDIPSVDAIIIPVGTGGLAAAIATVIKHKKKDCLIYGVQPEEAKTFFVASKNKDAATTFVPETTLASSLIISKMGANSYHNALPLLDKMLLVKESWIGQAMLHMMEYERYVVEGAAACPLAAIIGQLVPELKNKKVVCIVSGGNIDSFLLSRCLQFGRAAEARFLKFTVEITDHSLSQADLFQLLRKKDYNIIDQTQEHRWTDGGTYKLKLTLLCQTHNLEHALKLRRLIQKTYPLSSEFENEPFVDKRTCECFAFSHVPYIAKPPVENEDHSLYHMSSDTAFKPIYAQKSDAYS